MKTPHAPTIAADLDQLLRQLDLWLAPRVAAECPAPDAAKLRIFRANLAQARDRVVIVEEGIDQGATLSAALEALAERVGDCRLTGVTPRAVVEIVAIVNALAAHSWAIEVALRASRGAVDPEDLEGLKLARALSRQGVRVGLGTEPSPGPGGAA